MPSSACSAGKQVPDVLAVGYGEQWKLPLTSQLHGWVHCLPPDQLASQQVQLCWCVWPCRYLCGATAGTSPDRCHLAPPSLAGPTPLTQAHNCCSVLPNTLECPQLVGQVTQSHCVRRPSSAASALQQLLMPPRAGIYPSWLPTSVDQATTVCQGCHKR
jgi:hypothetical protein